MPTYLYACKGEHEWDVIKRVAEIDDPEHCPTCKEIGERRITRTHFYGASDWNRQEFNPGLGCVTNGFKDASRKAKDRGMIEVGNEPPEKIHQHFDKAREETRAKRWADADREMLYD